MEDALPVLGDGARRRVPVRGAVPSTVGDLRHDSGGEKQTVVDNIVSHKHKVT